MLEMISLYMSALLFVLNVLRNKDNRKGSNPYYSDNDRVLYRD